MHGVPVILDRQLRPVAVLDTAADIRWELKLNDLNSAEFALDRDDPANEACTALSWVQMWDGDRDLGVYRISSIPSGEEQAGGVMVYGLEHVLALLLDKLVWGQLELKEVAFPDAIRQVLAKQTTEVWTLGDCDFDTAITLTVADDTLLSAVQKICGQLKEEYTWSYDTSSLPFRLHIRRADADAGCGIHYHRNLVSIHKTMETSTLVTRLFLKGGAGRDGKQVTIEKLTEDGVPYIEADTIGIYGEKEAIYQNGDLITPEDLLARGEEILEEYKTPLFAYEAAAIDLYRLTGYAWDLYEPGKQVLVMDDEHGVHIQARIVSVSKQDARGDPGSITITIANQERDELGTVQALADKMSSVESAGIGNQAAYFVAEDAIAGCKTEIKKNSEQILLRATKEEYNELTGRVSTAESAIKEYADDIQLYVKYDDNISAMIELSGDGVDIRGGIVTLTGYVKTSELEAEKARMDNLLSGTLLATGLAAKGASIDSLSVATRASLHGVVVENVSCSPKTLKIGEVTCTFFAPADATFDVSDMPGYAEALRAAMSEGAAGVTIAADEITSEGGEAWYKSTKQIYVNVRAEASNGEYNTNRVAVDASDAYSAGVSDGYDDGKNDVTCTGVSYAYEAGGLYVTVSLSNRKSFTKQVSGY